MPIDSISLKGSTRTITEFFEYSINSILYQRGIYPPEDFSRVKKYDLTLLKTHDDELKDYIRRILIQVHKWLLGGKCNKLVLCIINKDEGDTVERWSFDVTHYKSENSSEQSNEEPESIDSEVTKNQIRALIRQITASMTFLPELANEGNYTFNVLAYTDAYAKVPLDWADSDSKEVENAEVVQFKSFSTNDHKVGLQVSYRF
ncbi:hypothetical protein KAFR_0J01100 [Kazachstania africana CBS 2517]|uniref:HORMA domain-containing protein n=1 Tax=Kazachstania africana (strain ATCC 22294 / BCRC 22015 / CBS 2517 / CECT 1963 / NBRC 1671 / NRRL Y-8276) TaxID=1071382 RepID=H2B0M7_KAZAF|nr:hypothetical protein KAFR_0J01100 [Kazachstania africana CBS 2517]CCF60177.1 hypothetical protein KAFR_0J01100 [Kazachstania africana CBS 2517]